MLAFAFSGDFEDMKTLKEENEKLRKTLEERKIIDRAKGMLMKNEDISEDEAYRKIQKLSMDRRKRMAEIAEAIITADEVHRGGEKCLRD